MYSTKTAKAFATSGLILSAFGGITQSIGNFYAAKSEQYHAASRAIDYDLAADIASMNADQEEDNALYEMARGEQEIGALSMRSGQESATARATMAARGVSLGVGSAAEIMASHEIMKQRDMLTINSNRVRRAASARMKASNYRGQAIMARTSADNMRRTIKTTNPWLSGFTSLMNTASSVANQWYQYNKPVKTSGK
ncbi:hypothetical protein [Prosthecochloris sp.]|uniref:hypothetical protein n=1 Tax=Prosthecochloris sp. TaxID=290513 RepID=UPI00257944CF|nr:hypothetical protein [Prosthecochloris sp.]